MIPLKKILIFISLLPLLSPVLVCSQNETILRVTARGKSSPNITRRAKARTMALRAAKVEGYRKLAQAAGLEKIYRVNSQPGHQARQPGHRVKSHQLEAFMKGARVVGKRFISDHEVDITMEIEASKIVDTASGLKKKSFKETVTRLRNRIVFLKKEMSRIKTELKKAINTLHKLEGKPQ